MKASLLFFCFLLLKITGLAQASFISYPPDTQCLAGNVFNFTENSNIPRSSILNFYWDFGDNTNTNFTTSNQPYPLAHSYGDSGTFKVELIISYIPAGASLPIDSKVSKFVRVIKQPPVITISPLRYVICSGDVTHIVLKSSDTSSRFDWIWSPTTGSSITGATDGHGVDNQLINQQLTNLSNTAADSIIYSVTPSLGGCKGLPTDITVKVNPAPVVTVSPPSPVICSGDTTHIVLKSSTDSSHFDWILGTNTGGITGATAGNGNENQLIDQKLTNPSNATAGSVIYSVTPTSKAGCKGQPTDITVTVNPAPVLTTSPLTYVICSGAATNISLTSSTGNSFVWTLGANTGGITGATASSGTVINQTLTNLSNSAAGSITYIVTPTSSAGCPGQPTNITVTVNPAPSVTTSPITYVICSGATPNIVLKSSTGNSSFGWTFTNSGGIIGAVAGSGSENQPVNQTLANPSNSAAGSIIYTVTPTSSAGCKGQPTDITVTVNPIPAITISPINPVICSGATTNIVLKSSTGSSSFVWTLGTNIGGITGAAAGSGSENQPVNQTLTNPSNTTAGSITYIVTPTSSGCVGQPTNIGVTVNPAPAITISPVNPVICSGTTTNIVLKSSMGNSNFVWTLGTNTGGITGASPGNGTEGQLINQTLTNPSNSTAGSITYIVTPNSATVGCPGQPTNITVTVNPKPAVTISPLTYTICSGATTNIVLKSSTGSSSFVWTLGTNTGSITGAAAGNGTENQLINQTLTNPSNSAAGSVIYIVTPTSSGCVGQPTNIGVTVNPAPVITISPVNPVICSGTATNIVLKSSMGNSSFGWTLGTNTGGITGASPGNGTENQLINQTLTNPSNSAAGSITYIVTPASSGCSGPSANITVTVNPKPAVTISPVNPVICSGTTTNIVLKSSTGGSSFVWTLGTNTGGITGASPGNGVENQLINQTLINPGSSAAGSITYAVTPTSPVGCVGQPTDIKVTVNLSPTLPPTITIAPKSPLCQFTNNQSFTATAAPGSVASDTKWGWQVITGSSIVKADVYDTTHSLTGNSIISFPNAGTVTVRAIDTVYSTKCTSYKDTVFTITATPSSDNASVFYYGQNLVCALNTPVSYQWGYDDAVTLASTTITGQTQQNYYIPTLDTKNKSYWVLSRFSNGCFTKNYYNKPVQLTGLIGTPPPDVTDNSNMEAITVFPNPVANRLTVYWKSIVQQDISFVITDITGKHLQTKTIQRAAVTGSVEFNVSNFSAGLYFISMFRNDKLISVQKVVKY